jgi:hypothetical protein
LEVVRKVVDLPPAVIAFPVAVSGARRLEEKRSKGFGLMIGAIESGSEIGLFCELSSNEPVVGVLDSDGPGAADVLVVANGFELLNEMVEPGERDDKGGVALGGSGGLVMEALVGAVGEGESPEWAMVALESRGGGWVTVVLGGSGRLVM